ncbi:MAG: hypothetical protein A2W09_02880 [Deltaproteobacteria bacterium RBG_16_50_11]|nr:MAG: hypothetical protein A2W09_02880 [Deltaproteobacteria bacterium RBG_16_50_11]
MKMKENGVKIFINTRGIAIINEGGLLVERFGREELLPANNVIICRGSKSEDSLIKALEKKVDFIAIGDCMKP